MLFKSLRTGSSAVHKKNLVFYFFVNFLLTFYLWNRYKCACKKWYAKIFEKKPLIFCLHLVSHWLQDQDPDPSHSGTDSRIRIRTKMTQIYNTAKNKRSNKFSLYLYILLLPRLKLLVFRIRVNEWALISRLQHPPIPVPEVLARLPALRVQHAGVHSLG